jgi:hypothetical protein
MNQTNRPNATPSNADMYFEDACGNLVLTDMVNDP